MEQTQKAIKSFYKSLIKNYKTMKSKIKTIWACIAVVILCSCMKSCNVTRVISNESQYFQKGDTAVMIQTKTIETYNAEKK